MKRLFVRAVYARLCRIYSDSGKERENAMKLILASGSPRRKELLTRAGAEFEVCVSDVDESGVFGTPEEVVSKLSEMKGAAVFASHKNDCVLSADTVVALDGEIFGKPKDADDALRMVEALAGRSHFVYTGVCVMFEKDGKPVVEKNVVGTEVFFRNACEEELKAYVATGEPMGKAGAYAIQGRGGNFVERINGDWSNVVGLPVCKVIEMLEKAGIRIW